MVRCILHRFRAWLCTLAGCQHTGRVVFAFGPVAERARRPAKTTQYRRRLQQKEVDMSTQMTITQFTTVRVKRFLDAHGNPATVDGVPEWNTDNSDILALEPADDGMSCKVTAVGMVGAAMVQMTADADLGAGFKPLVGTIEFDITSGQAVTVELEVDPPADVPE